jgi:hypothetical protein
MSDNIEKTERYLKGVVLPEHVSHQHRQQLRREVLGEIERRQTMSVRVKSWKYAAVLAVVIGVGAISVVGVNIGKYYYYGKSDDGAHIFISEDRESVVTLDDDAVTDVEQTRRDLEEIESLRQQDKRELLKVEETMTDGTLEMRVHVYKYELSDGRRIDMREGGEGTGGAFALGKARMEEWFRVRKAGPGEDLGTYEEAVRNRVFSFKRERYFLSDGTEVLWSVGLPKDDQ